MREERKKLECEKKTMTLTAIFHVAREYLLSVMKVIYRWFIVMAVESMIGC